MRKTAKVLCLILELYFTSGANRNCLYFKIVVFRDHFLPIARPDFQVKKAGILFVIFLNFKGLEFR